MRHHVTLLALLSLVACGDDDRVRGDSGPRPDVALFDTGECVPGTVETPIAATNISRLDLLLMIDDTSSMAVEQSTLASNLPGFLSALASGEATTQFSPARDIHIGVVTSDMGVGGHTVPTCDEANLGDDGLMRREGLGAGCSSISSGSPPFLSFRPADGGSPVTLGTEAACLVTNMEPGCGFTQPLDSVLKALTPSAGSVRFALNSQGHGDGANAGFLRDDSILAIVMLTDGDDCSAANPDLYNRDSALFTDPDLNLRCTRYADDALHSLQRYVDGLTALHRPEHIVFAAIAGVPIDIVAAPGTPQNWDVLVGDESVRDPRMLARPDPSSPSQLTPVCQVAGRGSATPAFRITSLARDLEAAGAQTTVQSICQGDYAGALDVIAVKIGDAMTASCLARPLEQNATGGVACDVVEVLAAGGECSAAAGRVSMAPNEDGLPRCRVCQGDEAGTVIGDDAECQALGTAGWFYESGADLTSCPASRRSRVTFLSEPTSGSQLRLVCPDPAMTCD